MNEKDVHSQSSRTLGTAFCPGQGRPYSNLFLSSPFSVNNLFMHGKVAPS